MIDRRGGIDWLCWPDFDRAPVFAHVLDPEAGRWDVAPSVPYETERGYLDGTNVLRTRFRCAHGAATLTDFMPVPASASHGPAVVRRLTVESGRIPMAMRMTPTDGFSTRSASMDGGPRRVGIRTSAHELILTADVDLVVDESGASWEGTLERGDVVRLVLAGHPVDPSEPDAWLKSTVRWWRSWVGNIQLPSYATGAVERSALALKLLTHQTGALVAAPTTSLPEELGGSRNWDYRYSWLRDSAEAVLALEQLHHRDEAVGFWEWLSEITDAEREISVAYTISGDLLPTESEISALSGHRRSSPVRVGNVARGQTQLDVLGHVIRAGAYRHDELDVDSGEWELVIELANRAADQWNEPDHSIWEMRSGPDHFLYSKLLCWVALDRVLGLPKGGASDGVEDRRRWTSARAELKRAILDRGWSDERQAFTMTLDGNELDASTLNVPLLGLLPPDDSRCRANRERISDELVDNGFVHRYLADDQLGEKKGPS